MLIKKSVILIMALLSSACGYHLRGALELPAGMKNVYLDGGSAELREQFKRAMDISSVALASSPETAGIIVKIFNEDNQRRVLSLGSGGTANDFELSYRFDYELVDAKNKVLSARQPIEIKREYYNDQLAVIAKDNEETIIRNEMYQQAVRTIVNRARVALEANPK
ncbi:MAG: LPS assembly lipoprotein LptE [Methylococcaceae bacterium]|nr:LPS assembly lipoprotein LptE [Methylococcaceae bacterium]MDD1630854.1 LPS assembly lipoprotein LptE [Methylococcaceae bacterium]MDD1636589.1 LPS assembly lipoprotein LptE [Methylococcaceae bacterium]MDD1643592.1 LPS assembly lipoprotein LptE [Methylococcaceae bacterium]OYV19553.1 MAG: LPS-assembly lipoprotein [Methylococcaceae bacterium NSM2-1]